MCIGENSRVLVGKHSCKRKYQFSKSAIAPFFTQEYIANTLHILHINFAYLLVDTTGTIRVHRQPDSTLACYSQISVFGEDESVSARGFSRGKLFWWK